jgi:hypothetical protein
MIIEESSEPLNTNCAVCTFPLFTCTSDSGGRSLPARYYEAVFRSTQIITSLHVLHPASNSHRLKWKPDDENSINFRLNLEFPPSIHLPRQITNQTPPGQNANGHNLSSVDLER